MERHREPPARGERPPGHRPQGAVELYHRRLLAHAGALAYVQGRGVDRRTIRRYRVGYAAGELAAHLRRRGLPAAAAVRIGLLTPDGREFLRGRVVVPELRAGQPVWCIGRTLDAACAGRRYLGLPGRKPLRGWEDACRASWVCLVEGPFDALALATWGVPAVALVGTPARAGLLQRLTRYRRGYAALDADPEGQEAAAALLDALGPRAVPLSLAGVRGVKDVSDLAQLPHGRALFDRRLHAAEYGGGMVATEEPSAAVMQRTTALRREETTV